MINPLIYFLLFLKASLFSSGGFSNLPSLHQDLIGDGWANEADFGQSVAIGQISPGPNGLWVISLGYLTYGLLGAVFALIAIVIPPFLGDPHFRHLHPHRASEKSPGSHVRRFFSRRSFNHHRLLDPSVPARARLERTLDDSGCFWPGF